MPYQDESTPTRYLAERGPGFFIYGEAEMARSRDEVTYLPNTVAVPGQVMARVTAAGATQGMVGVYDPAATNGLQTVAGLNWGYVDNTANPSTDRVRGVLMARDFEVKNTHITYQTGANAAAKATVDAALKALGIIVRYK